MDNIEVYEAKEALNACLDYIEDLMNDLHKMKTWSWVDMFGGGFLSSLIKRNKIQGFKVKLQGLTPLLEKAELELQDIDREMADVIQDSNWDLAFDLFFDNIFTDLRVHDEINNCMAGLAALREGLIKNRQELPL